MTCQDYLMGYRDRLDQAGELQSRIREIEIRLQGAGNDITRTKVKTSHGSRAGLEAELADLIRKRGAVVAEAEAFRLELLQFIKGVGTSDDSGKRQRRLLMLYYAEGMSWNQVRQCLQPVQKQQKKGGDDVAGVSKQTLFRVRLEALGAAELEFRRKKK